MSPRKKRMLVAAYVPTDREREVLTKQIERGKAEPPVSHLKVVLIDGVQVIVPDHVDPTIGSALLREAIGTDNNEFLGTILSQLHQASLHDGVIDELKLNFIFSVVKGVRPRDQIVAMLAIQMAAVHWHMLSFERRTVGIPNVEYAEIIDRSFNRLARTFALQVETLKRYQNGGEQTLTVQHVTVGQGGQAIVGTVNQNAKESAPKKSAARPLALTDSRQQPMAIIENPPREREIVPVRHKKKDAA
jgi:hypothetical protein